MLQLAQYQDGRLELQEVPAPQPPPGGILVRTTHTVISPGTEKMKLEQARMSLLEKAKARPDQVKKVLDTARTLGWQAALEKVRNRLESPTPLGYSAAGVVTAVDPLNPRFQVGDRVACGGAECAFHAEVIAVPDLLAAPIPDGVADWQAAYTTLASISLEAVRQSHSQLGDYVLVIGLGLVGQLVTSLLKAAGARVLGVDLSAARLEIASRMGAERTAHPARANVPDSVREWTRGQGADAVIICAGGKGAHLADTAITCLRDRGTLVIAGIYDAELSWKTAYRKDITVRYSRSYGPGRYDAGYEWGGRDYPLGYVRWTENRNFDACLHLMRTGALNLEPITTRRAAFADAPAVYDALMQPGNDDIGVVLEYGQPAPAVTVPSFPTVGSAGAGTLNVIGAGNFARTMLLPHLKGRLEFGAVINATGLSARHVKEKFGFARAETDAALAWNGDSATAVLIATRHHLHAPLVLEGLKQGRHLFVEKPLCLTVEELAELDAAAARTAGSVMVGFNRRFAPATVELRGLLGPITGAKSLTYHVFAGPLAPDHWYANVEESGGRILGEACHFFDFACFLLGAPTRVTAQALGTSRTPDSLAAQVEFADGSTAHIIYSAEGDSAFPKETLRVFAPGLVAECANFQRLSVFKSRKCVSHKFTSKGHAEEMSAWAGFLSGQVPHPLPYAEARRGMLLTFAALESLRQGATIPFRE